MPVCSSHCAVSVTEKITAGATIQVLLFAMVTHHFCYSEYGANGHVVGSKAQVECPIVRTTLFESFSPNINRYSAHTWLEIVSARWGKTAHLVFMFFGYVNLHEKDLHFNHLLDYPRTSL